MKTKNQSIVVKRLENVTDFSFAKRLEINRATATPQILSLVKSYEEFGTAATNVIILQTKAFSKKYEYYVADGQHSIEASLICGLPLNATIIRLVKDTALNVTKFVSVLNNTNKAWSNKDYTKSFSTIGVYEYQIFDQIAKETKLLTNDLQFIFLGGGSADIVKQYKSGNMKFPNEEDSYKMLEAVMKCKDRIPNKTFVRRALYKLMIEHKDYNFIANAINESKIKEYSENEKIFANQIQGVYERAKNRVNSLEMK